MTRKKFWLVAITSMLLFSCSDTSNEPVLNNTEGKGSIAFSLAKSSIPSEVGILEVRLERDGYDPTTTTAVINNFIDTVRIVMSDIPVGTWQLTIDAKDSSGHLRYTGNTSVDILENQTVLAFVHMTSVGGGVGSVEIFVTWQTQKPLIQIHVVGDSIFFISHPIPIIAVNISESEVELATCCTRADWRIQKKVDDEWTSPGECVLACPTKPLPLKPDEKVKDSLMIFEPGHYRVMLRYIELSPISSKKPEILEAYSNEFFVVQPIR